MKRVAVILGSDSDLKTMSGAMDALKALEKQAAEGGAKQ